MFSLAVAPCLVPAFVRAVLVISCARYVVPAPFTRLFLRLYAVSLINLVTALLRAGNMESVFGYRIGAGLAHLAGAGGQIESCQLFGIICFIFSDTLCFVVTFL